MALHHPRYLVSRPEWLFHSDHDAICAGNWKRQAARGREPRTLNKMVIGALLGAAAYILMVAGALHEQNTGPISWLWLVAYFLILTIGELYLSPTCLSLFNKTAPARIASTILGVWYMSLFLGSYLAGSAGRWWSISAKPVYFAANPLSRMSRSYRTVHRQPHARAQA